MRACLGLLILCVSCGDDPVGKLPDAPGQADAADAATSGVVSLTVIENFAPKAGVKVYFQNADSSLVMATMTGSDGVASATMEPGGFVTALDPFTSLRQDLLENHTLRTFAAVKPGDQLKLERSSRDGSPGVDVNVNIPLDGRAFTYTLHTNCGSQDITNGGGSGSGSGSPGGLVTLYGCGATTDVLIEVRDGNFQVVSSLLKTGVAISAGATIDLTQETYVDAADATWMYSNLPADVPSVTIRNVLVTPGGYLYENNVGADVTAGAASATMRRPTVAAVSVTETAFGGPNLGFHQIIDWGAQTSAYVLDAANVPLPELTSEATFEAATHAMQWTLAGGGATPDLVRAEIRYSRQEPEINTGWGIVAPFTGASVVFPVLPLDVAYLNPVASDGTFVDLMTMAKVPGGYDAARPVAFQATGAVELAVGASGRAQVETLVIGRLGAKRFRTR